jgi:hypothetical protein
MLTHKSLFVLLFAAVLTGCDVASKAIVVVNTPGAVTTPQTQTVPSSPSSVSAPQPSAPQPATSQPSSPATVINVPASTPPASVSASADLSIFKTKIPKPSEVKGYLKTEIGQATEHFKQRYEANKGNAFEVLKMWVDAELLATSNPQLGKSLIEQILAQNGTEASQANSLFNFAFLASRQPTQEKTIALIYQNVTYVESLNKLTYENFDNRILLMTKQTQNPNTGMVELLPISNPADALPENPKDGEVVIIQIKPNDSTLYAKMSLPASFKLIFDDGWKIIYSAFFRF